MSKTRISDEKEEMGSSGIVLNNTPVSYVTCFDYIVGYRIDNQSELDALKTVITAVDPFIKLVKACVESLPQEAPAERRKKLQCMVSAVFSRFSHIPVLQDQPFRSLCACMEILLAANVSRENNDDISRIFLAILNHIPKSVQLDFRYLSRNDDATDPESQLEMWQDRFSKAIKNGNIEVDKTITVSWGGGYYFLDRLLSGSVNGYQADSHHEKGLYVTPRIDKNDNHDHMDAYYANRTSKKYFDIPCKFIIKIPLDQLKAENDNAYEGFISAKTLRSLLKNSDIRKIHNDNAMIYAITQSNCISFEALRSCVPLLEGKTEESFGDFLKRIYVAGSHIRALSDDWDAFYNSSIKPDNIKKEILKSLDDILTRDIEFMRNYGNRINSAKGREIVDLANALSKMICDMSDTIKRSPARDAKEIFDKNRDDVIKLLHSKDNELKIYRFSLKTVAANIAIALTGIGLLAIAVKLAYSANTNDSGRPTFFFQEGKTSSEKLRDKIEKKLKN